MHSRSVAELYTQLQLFRGLTQAKSKLINWSCLPNRFQRLRFISALIKDDPIIGPVKSALSLA